MWGDVGINESLIDHLSIYILCHELYVNRYKLMKGCEMI